MSKTIEDKFYIDHLPEYRYIEHSGKPCQFCNTPHVHCKCGKGIPNLSMVTTVGDPPLCEDCKQAQEFRSKLQTRLQEMESKKCAY